MLALQIHEALGRIAEALKARPRPGLAAVVERVARELPDNLRRRLADWARHGAGKSKAEEALFADCRDDLRAAAGALSRLVDHAASLDPELLAAAFAALAPLLARIQRALTLRGIATFQEILRPAPPPCSRDPQVRARQRGGSTSSSSTSSRTPTRCSAS